MKDDNVLNILNKEILIVLMMYKRKHVIIVGIVIVNYNNKENQYQLIVYVQQYQNLQIIQIIKMKVL